IAPTEEMARMLRHTGVAAEKITKLCYAVDVEPFRAARAGPAPREACIGFLGQFAPHKGAHVLLEAVAILESRVPESVEPWSVRIHGEGVEGRHRAYPELLRRRASSARVTIAPPFEPEDVGRILAGFSCVVLPSLWRENAPLTALEARAAGIPVIASDVPGLAEIVEPGVHGALFEPGNARALADLLRAVILGRIAPRHAPSQPIGYAEHVAIVAGLHRRAAAGLKHALAT
ncbi:MAG TPA: glycosyltransferase, partial [Planctomycetota bacterium]|nr:glycosyltransferase [Planctomycetota bacterium]